MIASDGARWVARSRIRFRTDLWFVGRAAFGVSSAVAWVFSLGAHVLTVAAVAVVLSLLTGGGEGAPAGEETGPGDVGVAPLLLPVSISGKSSLPAPPTPEPRPTEAQLGSGSGRGGGIAGAVGTRLRTIYQSKGFPESEASAPAGAVVTRATFRPAHHPRLFEKGQSVRGRCVIDETGATLCRVLSAPAGQEEDALRVLEASRWEPALDREGRPVRSWMTYVVTFEN